MTPYNVQVVGDDSGTKGTGTHIVFGGLLARANVWSEFARRWSHCLRQHPAVEYFKLSEASGTGQFRHMTEVQRRDKVIALANVMTSFPLVALTVSVDLADQQADAKAHQPPAEEGPKLSKALKKLIKKAQRTGATAAHPYYDAWMNFLIAACADLWSWGVREPFDFIVDEHPSMGPRVAEWYPLIKSVIPLPMRSIMPTGPLPRDDKQFVPLQAADMIAGVERRLVERNSEFAWLLPHLGSLRKAPRCTRVNRAWYARNAALTEALGIEPGPEAFAELERLAGLSLDEPDVDVPKR